MSDSDSSKEFFVEALLDWSCPECGETNPFHLSWDDAPISEVCCTTCGVVVDSCTDPARLQDIWLKSHPDHRSGDLVVERGEKTTYSRRVHIVERISLHNRREPEISELDYETIDLYHEKLYRTDYFYRLRTDKKILLKRDVQRLLRFIDYSLWKQKETEEGTPQGEQTTKHFKKSKKPKNFSHKYLEKWNSIVERLAGIKYTTYTPEQYALVVCYLDDFSRLWSEWQPPRREHKYKRKYKNRKHFPNFNFAFQKAHHRFKMHKYNKLFPVPSTGSSLKRLEQYWKSMEEDLGYRPKPPQQVTLEECGFCRGSN